MTCIITSAATVYGLIGIGALIGMFVFALLAAAKGN